MSKPLDNNTIRDVQNYRDQRDIEINQVGIKGVRLPFVFSNQSINNSTVVEAEFTVNLQADRKGTHMSRFIETWQAVAEPFELASVKPLLDQLVENLDADDAQIHLKFPLFYERYAPVTERPSIMDFECEIIAKSDNIQGNHHFELQLMAPVTSLCPCSKEISKYSAHSQRSHLTINLIFKDEAHFSAFDIDEALHGMEDAGSSKLYPLLKRPDEKFVTERAYENPKFVEDIVRDLVLYLKDRTDLLRFTVESENFESIHNHQAYAKIEHSF